MPDDLEQFTEADLERVRAFADAAMGMIQMVREANEAVTLIAEHAGPEFDDFAEALGRELHAHANTSTSNVAIIAVLPPRSRAPYPVSATTRSESATPPSEGSASNAATMLLAPLGAR